jgi:hypothetical protein
MADDFLFVLNFQKGRIFLFDPEIQKGEILLFVFQIRLIYTSLRKGGIMLAPSARYEVCIYRPRPRARVSEHDPLTIR